MLVKRKLSVYVYSMYYICIEAKKDYLVKNLLI